MKTNKFWERSFLIEIPKFQNSNCDKVLLRSKIEGEKKLGLVNEASKGVEYINIIEICHQILQFGQLP